MTSRPTPSHVSASDALPTAEVLSLAKGFAARACAQKAGECAWPNLGEARRWIELIPLVALGALVRLCPEVTPERLALCLMREPGRIVSDLRHNVVAGTPRAALMEVVAQQVLGGGGMNDPVIIRANGLGGGRSVEASVRRSVEREHVAFVAAHKHRMSWQAMAKACGVNQHDLRRACDSAYSNGYAPPVTPPAPKPAAGSSVGSARHRPSIPPVKILRAIHRGARTRDDLAEVLGVGKHSLTDPLAKLHRLGWLAGHSGSLAGWVIPNAGLEAMRKAAEGGGDE